MKRKLVTSLLFLLLVVSCQGERQLPNAAATDSSRTVPPNVLFLVIDDLKPLLGCYDDPYVVSPNIDKIAAGATVFRRNYCQQAICGPSRANLLTGLRPDHTRVWDLATKMREENPNILTLPQYFRANGYQTAGIGKVFDPRCVDKQLDGPSWSIPFFKRSDDYFAVGATPNSNHQDPATIAKYNRAKEEGRKKGLQGSALYKYARISGYPATEAIDVADNAYTDGANVNHAIDIMGDLVKEEKPFFLTVGITKPHLPFTAPRKYWDMYDREELPLATFRGVSRQTPDVAFHNAGEIRSYTDIRPLAKASDDMVDAQPGLTLPLAKQKELIHGYYAATSYADALVGKLTATLDSLGIDDNTIVVIVGDHGWHLGDHNLWCKHSNFEQAVQTPLIISVPGGQGNQNYALTEFVDIFPTVCDLAGLSLPDSLDGVSLRPVMNDPEVKVKDFAISQYPRNDKKAMGYSLRNDRFRYTLWVGDGFNTTRPYEENLALAAELYDYQVDPLETANLAEDPGYATSVKELHASLLTWMATQ